ncbi:hypothetical protein PVL29_020070 [Vitis rotundifolia]|uniref:Endonuclease/exonuclease/phosphatase domain-containing protein n=1 Tax=Vitis rotundifolia TaxID=103349 RepID=A0AA38Z245_VITRO|nr:hypothetical protein PVL29_020070 [Vitis rotundifolia]
MTEPCSSSISCTTFNILAPIYKRLDQQNQSLRESGCRAFWISRNNRILDWLLYESSSIICLQEFWVGNEELVHMYQKRLEDAGCITFQLARTNNRGDVAQLLHVQLAVPLPQNRKGNVQLQQEILIVNTHLLFPHDSSLSIARLHQVYKMLQYVESYQRENKLKPIPIILCGDWNGSKRGHVYKFLRSQGFVSSYDTSRQYTDSDADAHKYQLRKGSLAENDAFALLKADNHGDFITHSSFCEALCQINLIGHPHGLSFQETEDLWIQADNDGNGIIDYEKFQGWIWNPTCSEQREENHSESREDAKEDSEKQVIGLKVKNAVLYPREVEKGVWPENYSLSDHARLTVVFSVVRMLYPVFKT